MPTSPTPSPLDDSLPLPMPMHARHPKPDGHHEDNGLILSLQPEPETWQVAPTLDGKWTAILRVWNQGDVGRCRLCPAGSCVATDNFCFFQVSGKVSTEDARLFDTTGMIRTRLG